MEASTADLPQDGQEEHQDPRPNETDLPTHNASEQGARGGLRTDPDSVLRLVDGPYNDGLPDWRFSQQLKLKETAMRSALMKAKERFEQQRLDIQAVHRQPEGHRKLSGAESDTEQDVINSQGKDLQGAISDSTDIDDWFDYIDPARRRRAQNQMAQRRFYERQERLVGRSSNVSNSVDNVGIDAAESEDTTFVDSDADSDTQSHYMCPSFVYNPLETGQIRILEILQGRQGDLLSCKIRRKSLFETDSRLTYDCLSYCWHDGRNDSRCITVNGGVFSVSDTLFDALQQLRDPGVPRRVWVDAICINQADEREKVSQIRLMRHIYSNALGVIIWLGQFEPSHSGALTGSRSHHSQHRRREKALLAAINEEIERKDAREAVLARTPEELELVLGICDRPWFKRLWIVQELCLPKRVTVQFGSVQLAWEKFVAHIEQATEAAMMIDLQLSHIRLETRLAMLKFARDHWQSETRSASCTLLSQLAILRGRACSLPADQIFGMLAICKDGADDIQISYEKSYQEVYMDATLHCLRQDGLKVLSMCRWTADQMTDIRTISWVPDWSRPVKADEPPYFAVIISQNSQQSRYNACGNTKSEYHFDADAHTLIIKGCMVSEIVRIVPGMIDLDSLQQLSYTAYRAEIQNRTETSISAWYQEALDFNDGELSELQDSAFWHTTCALGADKPAPEVKGRWFDLWRRTVRDSQESTTFKSMLGEALYGQYTDHIYYVDYVTRTRAFFVTEDGRFGLAPTEAKIGDRIAAFVGGEVPFLLRRAENDHYKLVGECFCHGIMDGEIFTDDWNQQAMNILLC